MQAEPFGGIGVTLMVVGGPTGRAIAADTWPALRSVHGSRSAAAFEFAAVEESVAAAVVALESFFDDVDEPLEHAMTPSERPVRRTSAAVIFRVMGVFS